jgi:hypothetical protein
VPSERGQATVEWTGILLVLGIALAVLAASASRVDGRALGRLVADRIACTARGGCGREQPDGTATGPIGTRRFTAARPVGPRAPLPGGPSPARAAAAFRSLRGVRAVARRVWIACLGYERWRFEYEHPRAPTEPLPVGDALRIANACLNPVGFLAGG